MHVALKSVCMDRASGEVDLAHYFQALNGKSLRNHCVPILDILPVEGGEKDVIIVMPLLKAFDEPLFKTFGEVVAFLSQIFEVRIYHLLLGWYLTEPMHAGLGVSARLRKHHAWVSIR